jgi:uncharacterized protein YyaL (SSP411 family)
MSAEISNRLIHEKSPYLLQHAHNPVDWFPWGEDAFAKAQAEDKLLLISIGYATCHWCHVMERESFENPELAQYLNEHFVAIKVDREERPDVDQIYMDALHALGQQGGWPLNMFAMPDGRPISGGTYFPPTSRFGLRSFRDVLETMQHYWQTERHEILDASAKLTEFLQRSPAPQPGTTPLPGWDAEDSTVQKYRHLFDTTDGGFALQRPNKFPPSMGLQLLLRHFRRTGNPFDLYMVEFTLEKMRDGGIYDQVGGGLCRYSTDYQWLVPHFEKMLYDNALFVWAALECYQVTQNGFFREIVEDVLRYVARDLRTAQGAFCSAEDADSEGVEGKFYVWGSQEFSEVLGSEEAEIFGTLWGVTAQGNFEGQNILNVRLDEEELCAQYGIDGAQWPDRLAAAREALLTRRAQRVRPLCDDKVLTSWNALMISAMARAATVLERPDYGNMAEQALAFLHQTLVDESGRLLRRYRDGDARFPAYLCDYAQLGVACLDMYAWSYDLAYFQKAWHWANQINQLFRNPEGAYFETGHDAEKLLARKADGHDGVEPSGNTATAELFQRLHAYGCGEGFYDDAERILHSFAPYLLQAGVSYSAMLNALHWRLSGALEVVVSGELQDPETQAMLDLLRKEFHPTAVVSFVPPQDAEQVWNTIPLTKKRVSQNRVATAWVCRERVCEQPVHTAEALRHAMLKL